MMCKDDLRETILWTTAASLREVYIYALHHLQNTSRKLCSSAAADSDFVPKEEIRSPFLSTLFVFYYTDFMANKICMYVCTSFLSLPFSLLFLSSASDYTRSWGAL